MVTTANGPDAGLRGRFWLQGDPEDKAIPGTLFLRPGDHPLLELDGALTPFMRETSRQKLPDGTEVRTSSPIPEEELTGQSLTIHGTLDKTGEDVTLPSAFTIGWTMGVGPTYHRLQAFYALLGAHVDGGDARFTSVRLRIRHLDAWANLPGFRVAPGSADGSWTLAFEPPDVPPAAMANGARIVLEQVTGVSTPTTRGGQLERHLLLDVTDMPPTTYRDLDRTIAKPLMTLLTLAVGKECPLVEMMLSTGLDNLWLTVHNAALRAPADEIIPLPRILLPMAEIGLQGIATWLESSPNLGPLPSVVARASAQDDPLEAQLLELTSTSEGLHRLLRPGQKRMTRAQAREARAKAVEAVADLDEDVSKAVQDALNHLTDQSYPRRLLDLAEQVKEAVPGVTGDSREWKMQVSNTRNNLAHKLERGFFEDDVDAQESVVVLLSLKWLLTGLLLLQTGISPVVLGSCIGSHQPYRFFLTQARAWLPAVYTSSEGPT